MLLELAELSYRIASRARAQKRAAARDWRRVSSADVDLTGVGDVVALVREGWRLGWWTAAERRGG